MASEWYMAFLRVLLCQWDARTFRASGLPDYDDSITAQSTLVAAVVMEGWERWIGEHDSVRVCVFHAAADLFGKSYTRSVWNLLGLHDYTLQRSHATLEVYLNAVVAQYLFFLFKIKINSLEGHIRFIIIFEKL